MDGFANLSDLCDFALKIFISKLEQIIRRGFPHGHLGFAVVGVVDEAVIDRFRIGIDFEGDLFRVLRLGNQTTANATEQIEENGGGGFSCFNPRLMIGVDVDQ